MDNNKGDDGKGGHVGLWALKFAVLVTGAAALFGWLAGAFG